MEERKPKKKKRILLKTLIILFTLLVVFRILLPYIVLDYVNRSLSRMEEYYGHVEDIDIHLLRGAYVINDLRIWKKVKEGKSDKYDTIPFFSSRTIDLSVQWKALFKGRVVGEIYVDDADLRYVNGKHKKENVNADTADFRKLVDRLMPLTVNHFEFSNSRIHYIDPYSSPKLDIAMQKVYIRAQNLSNVNKNNELLPSTVTAIGDVYGGGFNLDMKMDPLAENPTFDLNARVTKMQLPQLNKLLLAYANFDVKKGVFSTYVEVAAKNGGFGGYVKPLISDLDVVQWNKEEGNFKQILWETFIGASAEILENQHSDQLGTKLLFSGKFDDPKMSTWSAITYLLRNAFIHSLKPSLDNTINIYHMKEDHKKSLIERIFGKKDKKDKKEKRRERKEERKKHHHDKKEV